MIGIVDLFVFFVFAVVYAWTFYNLPVLAAGVRGLRRSKRALHGQRTTEDDLPSFSVVVPVKNEVRVVGRLLEALSGLNYPRDKLEIVMVEDGSGDGTFEVCRRFADAHGVNFRVLQRSVSNGKCSALNYGVEHSHGDIVAVFDADSVPDRDALLNAAEYFVDPEVAAVQGRTLSINSHENMLTEFLSYEDAVWCEAYLGGKDALDLFVHLKGSCQFVRRDVLERLRGFDESFLSEDMEMSARLAENSQRIRYASDVRAWQESPADLRTLFGQRTRWFRGTMEVALKYGRLMNRATRKNLDVEATLFGPFVLIASLLSYVIAFGSFFATYPLSVMWGAFMDFAALTTTLMILLCGFALVYVSKPRRLRNVLWLPFVFFYWCLQAFIALYAALLIVLRRPKRWLKTEKSGFVASVGFG